MPPNSASRPDWERLLSSAARQRILPGAVLVGGTAAALHAEHRFSLDADHVLPDLRARFDNILSHLIVKRNATRDYLDFVALATRMGTAPTGDALRSFDRLYPQESGESALQQLQAQLAHPLPYDLDESELSQYKDLVPQWHDWGEVRSVCGRIAIAVFDHVCDRT